MLNWRHWTGYNNGLEKVVWLCPGPQHCQALGTKLAGFPSGIQHCKLRKRVTR